MKKKFLLVAITLSTAFSCTKDNVENDSTSFNKTETVNSLRNKKFNVVHNGQTLNISEDAVLAHLQHGDKFGSIEDNVIFQSIITNVEPIELNNPLFIDLRNSDEFISYNSSFFGNLNLSEAKMITALNGNAISIPILDEKNSNNRKEYVAYIVSTSQNQAEFSSVVIEEKAECNEIIKVDNLDFCLKTGDIYYYSTEGNRAINLSIVDNVIENVDYEEAPELSCFAACFRNSTNQCSNHFGCSVACGITNTFSFGIGCTLGFGLCCKLDCALGSQGSNCFES